jgi:hypothetical protein
MEIVKYGRQRLYQQNGASAQHTRPHRRALAEDFEAQCGFVVANIQLVLDEARATFRDLVKVNVLLTRASDVAAMNALYALRSANGSALRRQATANAGARRVNIERRSGVKLGRRLTASSTRRQRRRLRPSYRPGPVRQGRGDRRTDPHGAVDCRRRRLHCAGARGGTVPRALAIDETGGSALNRGSMATGAFLATFR